MKLIVPLKLDGIFAIVPTITAASDQCWTGQPAPGPVSDSWQAETETLTDTFIFSLSFLPVRPRGRHGPRGGRHQPPL